MADSEFRLIGITRPAEATDDATLAQEVHEITGSLAGGRFWRVHIRKTSPEAAARLLRAIDPEYYHLLSVHNASELIVAEFPEIGVHLTGASPEAPANFIHSTTALLSRSCHSLDELRTLSPTLDYAFLSPVFDSVSKAGYASAFTVEELRDAVEEGLITSKIFVLGGVTPGKIPFLNMIGFSGAAMLGAAWS